MLPDNPHGQTVDPTTLPPVQAAGSVVPLQPQAGAGAPMPMPPAVTPAIPDAGEVTARTKRLVEQYQNNPYQLSLELQQLKLQYLAERFNVNANPSQK